MKQGEKKRIRIPFDDKTFRFWNVKTGQWETEGGRYRIMVGACVADIRRQKCYTADPVTKTKVKNCGELPQYYMTDCHEAIIDRETCDKVKAEMKRRAGRAGHIYPFTGKIKCGICGRNFTRRKGSGKGKACASWFCRAKKETGITCRSRNYPEQKLMEICAELMGTGRFDGEAFEKSVKSVTAFPDGSLEIHFYDGRAGGWQR